MRIFQVILAVVLAMSLAGCSSKFKTYYGPEVTRVVVQKGERKMYLLHHGKVLKQYNIGLGFAPEGDKKIKGDGKTPEGDYVIDRRNPNSKFHLSLGISYPNEHDIAEALALGEDPGGDIFIHGKPRKYRDAPRDWTWGCIAISDRQMERVYAMVKDGTPVSIRP
ncbi:L,D-transpeptidase family protein [Thalassococcus sp. BH17M4-6]|uniref:L,D-transpeptidase family protein n=1 Tax=Thalassococcus sp. BH17M4-6 TaxID=3413148 RepID=UPI003BD62A22